MAKRDTTGGPRQRSLTEEDVARRREYKSRAEREREYQQYVLIATGLIVAIVAIIVIGALIYDNAVLPREALVTVNGDEVSVDDFKARVQYSRFQLAEQVRATYEELIARGMDEDDARDQILAVYSGQQDPTTGQTQPGPISLLTVNSDFLGQSVLNQIEREMVIKQQAEQFDIEVDEAKVDEEVNNLISAYTGRSLTETPSATPSEEPTITPSPFVTVTPSSTPTETPIPTDTPIPTLEGCTTEPCPTVTLFPTATIGDPLRAVTFTPTPTDTFTPLAQPEVAATVQAFRSDFFEQGDEETKLDEDAIRDIFQVAALETALRDYITSQEFLPGEDEENIYYVPEQDTYVKVRHILIQFPEGETFSETDTENPYYQEAIQVLEALNAGEPFAALALIHSDDPGSKDNGGFYDWAASNNYAEGFKEAVEDSPIGEFVGPVQTQFGYHIIQVLDRELRDVPESTLEQRRFEQFNLWLDGEVTLARIERREDWQEFIPDEPDYNDLLSDILPEFDPNEGFQDEE